MIKHYTALVISKALINVESTHILSSFHWKLFYLYFLYFYDKTKICFLFWIVLFLLFISLITTNTSCHPLHELFRKNSYVHYIITLENVKKSLIPVSHWHYQCENCISVLWLLYTKLVFWFTYCYTPHYEYPKYNQEEITSNFRLIACLPFVWFFKFKNQNISASKYFWSSLLKLFTSISV